MDYTRRVSIARSEAALEELGFARRGPGQRWFRDDGRRMELQLSRAGRLEIAAELPVPPFAGVELEARAGSGSGEQLRTRRALRSVASDAPIAAAVYGELCRASTFLDHVASAKDASGVRVSNEWLHLHTSALQVARAVEMTNTLLKVISSIVRCQVPPWRHGVTAEWDAAKIGAWQLDREQLSATRRVRSAMARLQYRVDAPQGPRPRIAVDLLDEDADQPEWLLDSKPFLDLLDEALEPSSVVPCELGRQVRFELPASFLDRHGFARCADALDAILTTRAGAHGPYR